MNADSLPTTKLTIGLLVFLILFIPAVLGFSALNQQSGGLKVGVVSVSDPHDVGQVTQITAHVVNRGSEDVTVAFSVIGVSHNNYNWNANATHINSSESKVFKLSVNDLQRALEPGQTFRVRVNAKSDSTYKGVSDLFPASVNSPEIRDPSFHFWRFDRRTGENVPTIWNTILWEPGLGGSENATFRRVDNSSAVIVRTPAKTEGDWAMAGYSQRVSDVPDTLTVRFANYSDSSVWEDEIQGRPDQMVGVRFVDSEHDKRIWLVYSTDVNERRSIHINGTIEYEIIVTPNQTASIHPSDVYSSYDWEQEPGEYYVKPSIAVWPPNEEQTIVGGFNLVNVSYN